MDECEAISNGMDGITIDQTMYVLIKNSKSISNGRHGFNLVTGTRYLSAVNNTMKNNGKYALRNLFFSIPRYLTHVFSIRAQDIRKGQAAVS